MRKDIGTKKLAVRRETILTLSDKTLQEIVGGTSDNTNVCRDSCCELCAPQR